MESSLHLALKSVWFKSIKATYFITALICFSVASSKATNLISLISILKTPLFSLELICTHFFIHSGIAFKRPRQIISSVSLVLYLAIFWMVSRCFYGINLLFSKLHLKRVYYKNCFISYFPISQLTFKCHLHHTEIIYYNRWS